MFNLKKNKDIEKEREYYSRECFLKEERYRKLKKQYKELVKENEQLKEQLKENKNEE